MKKNLLEFLGSKKVEMSIVLSFVFVLVLGFVTPVFATPSFVDGGKRLLQDILKWILILVPVAAAAMIGYHALMKTLSDGDPATIADRNKKMKTVLIGAIIAVSASALVTLILSYF